MSEPNETLQGKISSLEVYHTDAYAIAVANGYEGTITEWLESLKGEKGDKGDNGKDAIVDQTFSATSPNAQSGKAVEEAKRLAMFEAELGNNTLHATVLGEIESAKNEAISAAQDDNAELEQRLTEATAEAVEGVKTIPLKTGDLTDIDGRFIGRLCDLGNAIYIYCGINNNGEHIWKPIILPDNASLIKYNSLILGPDSSLTEALNRVEYGLSNLDLDSEEISHLLKSIGTSQNVKQAIDALETELIKQGLDISENNLHRVLYEEKVNALENEVGNIETALDNIIAIQNSLIGGDA